MSASSEAQAVPSAVGAHDEEEERVLRLGRVPTIAGLPAKPSDLEHPGACLCVLVRACALE